MILDRRTPHNIKTLMRQDLSQRICAQARFPVLIGNRKSTATRGTSCRSNLARSPNSHFDGYNSTDGVNDGYVTVTLSQAYASASGVICANV
jgi:hypothetical protein